MSTNTKWEERLIKYPYDTSSTRLIFSPDFIATRMPLWQKDVFLFINEVFGIQPALPIDELRDEEIEISFESGEKKFIKLFDKYGRLIYPDLSIYKKHHFKYQEPSEFKSLQTPSLTWHQTLALEAYNRAINTFGSDNYDVSTRQITITSGHGCGKTSYASMATIHFLVNFYEAQIGATANTENQLKEIFLKEFAKWFGRMPQIIQDNFEILDDIVRVKDPVAKRKWFMRARVSSKDNPEAVAGLHGEYVMIFIDEASGVDDAVVETMSGSLTGDNWVTIFTGNPTRNDGFFYESHRPPAPYTKLHFSSLDSPIVSQRFVEKIKKEYGEDSPQYKVRVLGEFLSEGEIDKDNYIPLFANVNILFEEPALQVLNNPIMGVDPAASGSNSSVICVRDNLYLKDVLNEQYSTPKELAAKIRAIRDAYNIKNSDVVIDSFGIGAQVLAEMDMKGGESPVALLTGKHDSKKYDVKRFVNLRDYLAWRFREWLQNGGIIITNNRQKWMRELKHMKFKNVGGKIRLMDKAKFKKDYGFSPDLFDAAIYTFYRTPFSNSDHIIDDDDLSKLDSDYESEFNFDFSAKSFKSPDKYSSI